MNANGAEKLRREALMQIGNGLREYYSDVLKEAIPNQLADLLQRLVAVNGGEEQTIGALCSNQ
jgi:hypothetical protein